MASLPDAAVYVLFEKAGLLLVVEGRAFINLKRPEAISTNLRRVIR